jgi:inhibitor of cysteine peptidase
MEIANMPDVVIGEADVGRRIKLSKGSTLTIRLPENPTTGYQWTLANGDTTTHALLSLARKTFDTPAGGGAGAGGERSLVFVAQAVGDAHLKLVLKQPWLDDASADRSFEIDLSVVP